MKRGAPPPPEPPCGYRFLNQCLCVRAVAVLAPCAVLRFTRPRSAETARALHPAGASVAGAALRRTRFGRAAAAAASNIVALVVPFRAAARFICLLRGDFGFPSLVWASRPRASGCGSGPSRPAGSALPRPPAPLPVGRGAPAARFRRSSLSSDYSVSRFFVLGLPKKPLALHDPFAGHAFFGNPPLRQKTPRI